VIAAEDLKVRARAAGARGESYSEWLWANDADGEAVCALRDAGDHSVEAAHREGARERKLAEGWVSIWTTAPRDYDAFGTEEVEQSGEWCGKVLRRVLAHPHHADYQSDRYGSGLHYSGREDPRVEEARRAERLAAEARERAAAEGRRAGGLFWLRELPDAELGADNDALDEEVHRRGCSWQDVRAERRRREELREAARIAAQWTRCRPLISDGATLVDDGAPSSVGAYGYRIPGRDPAVYANVRVKQHYDLRHRDDADRAEVAVYEGGHPVAYLGSVALVAARIARGELRLAREGEVFAPRAVLERIGCPFTEVARVEAFGRVAWVGRPLGSAGGIVLDDAGRLVRAKKLREAAEAVHRAQYFGAIEGRSFKLFDCGHPRSRPIRFAREGAEPVAATACVACGAARVGGEKEWRDSGCLELNVSGEWREGDRVELGASEGEAPPSPSEVALLRELHGAACGAPLALADLYRARRADVAALEKRGLWFSRSATQGNLTEAGAAALRGAQGAP